MRNNNRYYDSSPTNIHVDNLMETYTLIVDRNPKVKARPRHTKGGRVFTPKTTLIEEDVVAQEWANQIGQQLTGPLEIVLMYSPTATSITVLKSPPGAKTLRGDLDNYVKLTLDALNGVAWEDDRQVVRISAVKVDKFDKDD